MTDVLRAEAPPAGAAGARWVPAPRRRDLGLPPGRLFEALSAEGAPRDVLEGIARVVAAAGRPRLEALKESFAATPAPDANRRFLSTLLEVLREGELVPVDAATYARATDQRFLADVPVRVRWDALDPTWLGAAREDPELARALDALGAPEAFRGRALLFYRGLTPTRIEGWYPAAKLDVLLAGLLSPLRRLLPARAAPPEARANRWVRRTGLADTPWWSGLFTRAVLTEPCFRQVVLLYRGAEPEGAPLTLKLFRDIPLADAEMVFPERRLGIRTLDAVLILGSAIAAAPAIVRAVAQGGGTAIALATLLGGYTAKVVGQYLDKRRRHRARLTQTLYERSQDTDVGVLQYLVDAALTQSTHEIALAWHHLQGGGPMTAEALDRRVEAWLGARFSLDEDTDYDVRDALERARAIGIVERSGEMWVAGDAEAARAALQERWSELGP